MKRAPAFYLGIAATVAGCDRGADSPGQEAPHMHYRCADLAVTAYFTEEDGVRLEFSSQVLSLPRVQAASGARYADAAGNEFWTKDGALQTLHGQPRRDCAVLPE